jgi:hypothetical protein
MRFLVEIFWQYCQIVWNLLEEIGSHLVEGHEKVCSPCEETNKIISSDIQPPEREKQIKFFINDYM